MRYRTIQLKDYYMEKRIILPKKIKVGFCNRSDTYTQKLAYIIYYDENGVLRKECSWESWRDKNIPPADFDNVPTEGFVLNKNVGGYHWGNFETRQAYIRVYDPRGFEFEITVPNLLYILECANSYKGKGLEGKFVYCWKGTELILLPVDSLMYKEAEALSNRIFNKSTEIKTKDLKQGFIYVDKNGRRSVYHGKLPYYRDFINFDRNRYYFEYLGKEQENIYKKYIMYSSIPKGYLIGVESETPIGDYTERFSALECVPWYSPIDESKTKYVHFTLESFTEHVMKVWWAPFIYFDGQRYITMRTYTNPTLDKTEISLTGETFDNLKFDNLKDIFDKYQPLYKELYLKNGKFYGKRYKNNGYLY